MHSKRKVHGNDCCSCEQNCTTSGLQTRGGDSRRRRATDPRDGGEKRHILRREKSCVTSVSVCNRFDAILPEVCPEVKAKGETPEGGEQREQRKRLVGTWRLGDL